MAQHSTACGKSDLLSPWNSSMQRCMSYTASASSSRRASVHCLLFYSTSLFLTYIQRSSGRLAALLHNTGFPFVVAVPHNGCSCYSASTCPSCFHSAPSHPLVSPLSWSSSRLPYWPVCPFLDLLAFACWRPTHYGNVLPGCASAVNTRSCTLSRW